MHSVYYVYICRARKLCSITASGPHRIVRGQCLSSTAVCPGAVQCPPPTKRDMKSLRAAITLSSDGSSEYCIVVVPIVCPMRFIRVFLYYMYNILLLCIARAAVSRAQSNYELELFKTDVHRGTVTVCYIKPVSVPPTRIYPYRGVYTYATATVHLPLGILCVHAVLCQ